MIKEGHRMNSYRYLIDFDAADMEKEYHDVVIIGSGIAGAYTALEISDELDVLIITKEKMEMSNSVLAQGGIAVSLDKGDSPELHFKDTLYAGAGLCDEKSVWVLVNEAAENIKTLLKYGVNFDKREGEELSFTREGAHSMNRIIHAGDTTGKEVVDKLIQSISKKKNIRIKERTFAIDIITEDNRCRGILAFDETTEKYKLYIANVVICAAGGYGQIYSNTTNPAVATGDGVCLAYRAGAQLMDLEFIQFHPTVLFHPENKTFLISEAVRGEGALLRNINGERFMPQYHELNELAPRDIVSRAIFSEMKKTGSDHVFLDITSKSREYLERRFPNIFKTCLGYGIDMSKDFIPVAPSEHYCMGGIRTDVFGRTNIEGFYACGESACTGIHGANRLASNSLLEGLVFGHKICDEVNNMMDKLKGQDRDILVRYSTDRKKSDLNPLKRIEEIQSLMTDKVGINRHGSKLKEALHSLEAYSEEIRYMENTSVLDFELQNMVLLSKLVVEAALEREESRGAHYREDFNKTDDVNWKRNIIKKIGD